MCCSSPTTATYFNPRSSCEERRRAFSRASPSRDFNPRSSCEERRIKARTQKMHEQISIHAPHARSDKSPVKLVAVTVLFQSTLLMRGATGRSSHRLHRRAYFNPRSSCEERRSAVKRSAQTSTRFQSTLLMREATLPVPLPSLRQIFQSTLLMRGATIAEKYGVSINTVFQSTLLMRGATSVMPKDGIYSINFNPRSSCEERPRRARVSISSRNFNPRSSCEERPDRFLSVRCSARLFQSTLLMRGATKS